MQLGNSINLFSAILDTLIVSFLIYSILLFLRRSRSYLVFIGLGLTIVLYILAKILNLATTFIILQYVVSASFVILAVVFQSEIRKYLELLGFIGSRQLRSKVKFEDDSYIKEIVTACVKMAQAKIGALIIIQGRINLTPFLEGGVDLDGLVSEEVLLSIFDPYSEGHDGALVLVNDRIFKFGTHLPLSTNFKETGKRGTRHGAALGLSEIADSLSIVVSEEKGTISVAKDGKIKTLKVYDDLENEIKKFLKTKFNKVSENIFVHALKHNFWLKVSSVALGFLVWLIQKY